MTDCHVHNHPVQAETHLEEKFQELEANDEDGAVRRGYHSTSQQGPPRKICQYYARHGNCYYGSRCRFEHAQPYTRRPPRFQSQRGGPRSYKDQPPVSQDGKTEKEDGLKYSMNQNEGTLAHTAASPSQIESAAAKNEETDLGQEGSGSRNVDRNQRIKSDKICQFFVRGRCWKGRRCRFLHPRKQAKSTKDDDHEAQHGEEGEESEHTTEPAKEVDSKAQDHEEGEKSIHSLPEQRKESSTSKQSASVQNCRIEPSKSAGVRQPRPAYVAQGTKKYRRDEVDDVEGSRLRRTEIEQLVKRFPKSKVKVNRDCAEFFQCIISFSPTDPDWPFDVKVFELQVDIPSDYPFEMMTVTLPAEQDLPETVRRYLEVSVEEWLDDKERQLADSGQVELVFRPFLRWLDRNIEDAVTEGLKQLKRELVAKAAGLEFISAKQLQKQYPAPSYSSDDKDNDDDNSDEAETESDSQDEDTSSDYDESDEDDNNESGDDERAKEEDQSRGEQKGQRSQQDKVKAMMVEPERRGTEVMLKNLQLKESAATLYFEKVCLMVQCERCKATSEFMATPGRVNVVQCGQCSQTQMATYRPAMAHHFSAAVGFLDLDACVPHDLILLKSSAVVACIHCSKDTRPGAVTVGQAQDHWCRVCHHKLRVATDGVRFTQLEPSKTPQSLKGLVKVVVPTRKRVPKDPAIQEGKPLPNFGTCRHYKKSYRWLRFPCCGKCYPCDVCHDSKEDHEMVFANRMVCGFCCREQPYAAERPCKGCDMNLTRVHTKHWEGGQGCRDKISMSRNDKHKFKNTNKTLSRHGQKVKDMQSKKKTKLRHT
ncbi:uncharacterized protein LOC143282295 [Babylonia areolata]|uniref:uncharacterized protein LOC143282295 n=1 Tax=Babylonia areolata TaxID=304850 RepID=UPI003FD0385C